MKSTTFVFLSILSLICFCGFTNENHSIECSDNECYGQYKGLEFINGSDIAHQFSNKMSAAVGEKIKRAF